MNAKAARTHPFARQPLSDFGKLAVISLIAAAVASGILAFAVNYALVITGILMLAGAGLAATGFRWMPVLITALSGLYLVQMLRSPYVDYHLIDPKGGGFFPFVMDVLIAGCMFIAFGASIGAAVENYWQKARQAPGTRLVAVTGLVATIEGILFGAILIAAVAKPPAPAGTTYTNGVPTVHLGADNFAQPSVTIPKGSKLLLVDDVSALHVFGNGSWDNGTARRMYETGAPNVQNVRVDGGSVTIGPFTTGGTYHIFCVVHPGMTLTIIVR